MIMACLCAICTIQAQEVSGIFDLNGRSLDSGRLAKPIYNVHAEGRVVVTIMVNPAGQVISTSINKRTNTVNCVRLQKMLLENPDLIPFQGKITRLEPLHIISD